MRLRGTTIGALNLFNAHTGALDEADVEIAQALADVATILQHRAAIESQVVNDQLNNALNTRVVIEQAKGMVAERESLDMEASFARLRLYARNHNLRLADVGEAVISGAMGASALDHPGDRR